MNKKYSQINNIDIKYFWNNYTFTSIYGGQKRRRKINYQTYISDNNILSIFQVDLLTFPELLETKKKINFYVLVCIDQVSKFAFCSFLKNKLSKDVKQAFNTILQKIEKKRKENPISYFTNKIIFYGDFGQEFVFKEVKNYCLEKGAKLINIGMPSVTKLGIVERLIRTLQEMISVNLENIETKEQYKKEFKLVLNIYNNQTHSFLNTSPKSYLESKEINSEPWNIKKQNNFNYFKNKKIIQKHLKLIKKQFPINQPVRMFKKVKKYYKHSQFSTWSNQIYFVNSYKIPLLSESDIGIYLEDQSGKKLNGITYKNNLKKVKIPDYMKIKKIITFLKKKVLDVHCIIILSHFIKIYMFQT